MGLIWGRICFEDLLYTLFSSVPIKAKSKTFWKRNCSCFWQIRKNKLTVNNNGFDDNLLSLQGLKTNITKTLCSYSRGNMNLYHAVPQCLQGLSIQTFILSYTNKWNKKQIIEKYHDGMIVLHGYLSEKHFFVVNDHFLSNLNHCFKLRVCISFHHQ